MAHTSQFCTFYLDKLLFGVELNTRTQSHNNRLSLTFGGGEQIAVTQFHTYSHGLIFTSRLVF